MDITPSPTDDSSLRAVTRSWGMMWIVGFAAMMPLLLAHLLYIWRFEHYRYFPFAILLCGYLVWLRWDRRIVPPEGFIASAALAVSLLLLLAGGFLYSPWLGAVAFVLMAGSFLFSHRSRSGERLVLAWLPLLMLLRLPLNYDQQIVVGLQQITTKISSYLLDGFGISHDTIGNVIRLPDRELLVAEACSGVQSAFTLCFVAIAVVAWKRRSLVVVPFALATALLWAVLANVTRVTSIAVAATAHLDLSTGWPHELLGYAVLAIAIGLVISTDRLLRTVFHPIGSVRNSESPNPLIRGWDACFKSTRSRRVENPYMTPVMGDEVGAGEAAASGNVASGTDVIEEPAESLATAHAGSGRFPVLLASGVLVLGLVANLPVAMWSATAGERLSWLGKDLFFIADASLLDDADSKARFFNHRIVRDGDDPRLGTHADMWNVQHPQFQGELILSQSYAEWHPLRVCYQNKDWRETNRYCTHVRNVDAGTQQIAVSTFHNKDGLYAYLLYTGFLETGEIVEPPGDGLFQATVQRCRRLFNRNDKSIDEYRNHAMLQLWIAAPQELSESALTEAIGTFGKARDRFAKAIKDEVRSEK